MSIPVGTDVAIHGYADHGPTHRVIDQAPHGYVWICPIEQLPTIAPDQRHVPVTKIPGANLVIFGEVEDPPFDEPAEDVPGEVVDPEPGSLAEIMGDVANEPGPGFHVSWDLGNDRVLNIQFDPTEERLTATQLGKGWKGLRKWPAEAATSIEVSIFIDELNARGDIN